MAKGKRLNQQEQGQILAFKKIGWGIRKIAKEIGRSKCVVLNFLKNPAKCGQNNNAGRKKKLSERNTRQIANKSSNSTLSCSQIHTELKLDASVLMV